MNNDVIYEDPMLVHLIKYRNHYQSLVTLFRTLEQQQVHGSSRVEETALLHQGCQVFWPVTLNIDVIYPRGPQQNVLPSAYK